jgi:glucokinase
MTGVHQPALSTVGIAIDVGGTTVKGMLFRADGTVLARYTAPTFRAGRAALESIYEVINALLPGATLDAGPVEFVGLCAPGSILPEEGVVSYAANLNWVDVPLKRLVSDRFSLPVRIDHDARAAALAEAAALGLHGVGADLLFIPIGTGVSSAILLGGRPLIGVTGSAGEIGHVSVFPGGEPCTCGQRGCVETYASASRILSRYRAAGGIRETVPEILAALEVDDLAAQIWDEAIDALARGIVAAIATIDPGTIVIGGGLSRAGDALLNPLQQKLSELLTWRSLPRVTISALGSDAGIIGAALLNSALLEGDPGSIALKLHDDLLSSELAANTGNR